MEEILRTLLEVIKNLGNFYWNELISLFSLIAAWITIAFLLKDKIENKRPYLQITFELVRDSLACVVLRNVGNVPLEIRKMEFDNEFLNQLPKLEREKLSNNNINKMKIFPDKQWVICLGVIVPDILNNFEKKILNVKYEYSKVGKRKRYKEFTEVDFEQYSRMLVYVSEIDELRLQNKKIEKEIKNITKEVKNLRSTIIEYANLEDTHNKIIVGKHEEENNK